MDELLLTVETAARRLSLSRSKTYQLIASGALRSVAVGRSRRVPVDALEAFVGALVAESTEGDESC
jgi:excisionase family DNA binding protein